MLESVDSRPEIPSYWHADTSSGGDVPMLNVNALMQAKARYEAAPQTTVKSLTDLSLKAAPQKPVESLTNLAAERYVEPAEQHARKQDDITRKHLKAFHAAKTRIMELKLDARAEGYGVSAVSENDLQAFLNGHVFTRRPFITLLDNGNFRILWKNAEGEQIGLQFRGGKQVQYVFFARREDEDFMARASGRDSLAGIDRQIEAHDLGRLMTA